MPEAIGPVRCGRLRALAVGGNRRFGALPDLPTLAESALPDVASNPWIGLLAPAGTPADIVETISMDVRAVLGESVVRRPLIEPGALPAGNAPAEFATRIQRDRLRCARLIGEKIITVERSPARTTPRPE